MQAGAFSQTALRTAALRLAHQSEDGARIFSDPLAAKVFEAADAAFLERARAPEGHPLRLFVALRARLAEDVALAALAEGARQILVLGAGFDTFAHRLAPRDGLKVFEVDHPATQAEKRRRFALSGLTPPPWLIYAPCDFETQTLEGALASAGFDAAARVACLWLGVAPYLTPAAFEATLRFLVARPCDVVFDYANPPEAMEAGPARRHAEAMAARVARAGEPFLSHFDTPDLHRRLAALGFAGVDDFGPRRIAERLGAPARESDLGGHILHAWRR